MDKWKLIGFSIKQLKKQWKIDKDCFDCGFDSSFSNMTIYTITWSPKIEQDPNKERVEDPLKSPHYVIVTLCPDTQTIRCMIYNKPKPTNQDSPKFSVEYKCGHMFFKLTRPYRDFMSLRALILENESRKYNNRYLEEFTKIFPDTFNDYFLGDDE